MHQIEGCDTANVGRGAVDAAHGVGGVQRNGEVRWKHRAIMEQKAAATPLAQRYRRGRRAALRYPPRHPCAPSTTCSSPPTSARGVSRSASAASASRVSSSRKTKRISLTGLDAGFHGEMDYMARHGTRRSRAARPCAGHRTRDRRSHGLRAARHRERMGHAVRRRPCICIALRARTRLSQDPASSPAEARRPHRRRHRTVRLPRVHRFRTGAGESAARDAGLGWIGKHTLLLSRDAGSWFFLGEIYTDLPLPLDEPASAHCGTCTRCIDICPTQAIVAPYKLDARRCTSYLNDRAARLDPGRTAPLDRQSRVRMRRLPDRVSVEQVCAAHDGERFRAAARARVGAAGRCLRVERSGIPGAHVRGWRCAERVTKDWLRKYRGCGRGNARYSPQIVGER